jgi:protein TonB
MQDARSRLLTALAASAALHLALIYAVTVRAPEPLTAPLIGRLQREPPVLGESPGRATPPPGLRPASPPGASSTVRGAPLARVRPPAPVPPAAEAAGPVPLPTAAPDTSLPSVVMPLLADPTWYTAEELDVYPRALGPVRPAYPDSAAAQGMSGEVTLVLMVDENGAVQDVSVANAAPEGHFEAAAVAAFRVIRFEPARRDGRSVRSRIVIRVSFDAASASSDPLETSAAR